MSDYWKEIEAAPPPVSASAAEFLVPTNKTLGRRTAAAAAWLWAFAALSIVNLVLAWFGLPIRMVVSLFFTELGLEIGRAIGSVFAVIALVCAGIAIGFTVFLGVLAKRYQRWAFIAGITLLAIDAVMIYFLTTLAGLYPFLLHALAIYFLFVGFKAAKLYQERKAQGLV